MGGPGFTSMPPCGRLPGLATHVGLGLSWPPLGSWQTTWDDVKDTLDTCVPSRCRGIIPQGPCHPCTPVPLSDIL